MKKLCGLIVFVFFHLLNIHGQAIGDNIGKPINATGIFNTQNETLVGEDTVTSINPESFSAIVSGSVFRTATASGISPGTYAIGPKSYAGYSGTFTSIKAAITAITSVSLTGNMIFELQPDYDPSVETLPITLTSNIGSSSTATVTFRPAASVNSVINFTGSNSVITNSGANYIIFDGRNGGTGSNRYFQFTSTSSTGVSVFYLNGDSQYNQILYSVLKGSATNTTATGCILSISSLKNGNNFYTVDHCNFDATGFADNCIYSTGKATDATITNNNFFDFRSGAGINLSSGSNNAVIDNNSFYQTTSNVGIGGTTIGILVAGGNNVSISNNNIGGSGPGLTGVWTVMPTSPAAYNFTGINVTKLATTSKIYNNKIQNFDWKSTISTWTGINVSGSVNVGTDGANYIGNNSGNDNIKVTYYLAGASQVNGIIADGAAVVENNIIGSITTLLASGITATGAGFTGINSTGTGLINHNTIGSATIPNSINTAAQSATGYSQNVYGINYSGSTAVITNNTIANICNGSIVSSGVTRGILISNLATSVTVTSNDIHSVSTSQPVVSTGLSSSLNGINVQATSSAPVTITGNTIYDLINNANAAVCINGILYSPTSGIGNQIDKNYIHSFITSSNSAIQNGLNICLGGANVQNNVIRLGIDKEGNSIGSTAQITGILKSSTTATNLYFNTVYIGGSGVVAGVVKTYALNLAIKSVLAEDMRNNIFVNMRTNAVANKLNYAVLLPAISLNSWTADYNIYNVSVSDGKLASVNNVDMLTIKALQDSYPGADLHSGFGDPLLVNPAASLAALDLHPATTTEAEATGTAISGITDDITGAVRSSNTPTDIGAYSGNFTQVALSQDVFSPVITYNKLANDTSTVGRMISSFATVTDNLGGINVTPGTKPRLYYKTALNNNAFVGNTSADNGWKWVEATGAISPFDFKVNYAILYGQLAYNTTIQYFVVAQNQAAVPFVSFNPSIGASGTSVASTGMTAPATPYKYVVVPPLPATINVGANQTYTTLTGTGGLFAAINNGVILANTVATIKSDLTEPGTYPLTSVNEGGPNAGTLTLTILSDGNSHVISGSTKTPLISIKGVKRLIIDGGNAKNLTFRNTLASGYSAGPVVQFDSISQNDTIRNCYIESNSPLQSNGVITIGSIGTNIIMIHRNDIRDARGGTVGSPVTGICSVSNGNTIIVTDNNIYNQKNASAISYGIYFSGMNGSTITGNSFYMESGIAGPYTGIYLPGASNMIIARNYIGGSAPKCGGSLPFTISGAVAFNGIYCNGAASGSTIQGNTIQNISMTNAGTPTFYGINNYMGAVTVTGNIIGSRTSPDSILISGTGTSVGIYNSYTITAFTGTFEGNTIANITLTSTSGSPVFYGMKMIGGTVRKNFIFSIGAANTRLTPVIYGIYNSDGLTVNEFSNNIISLNGGASTAPSLYGFYDVSAAGTTGFYYNSINLYGAVTGTVVSYAFNRTGSSAYVSTDNILVNSRTGGTGKNYAVYSIYAGLTSDFNDLYVAGTTLGHWGAAGAANDVAGIADWSAASSQDINSIDTNPTFTTSTNLLPSNSSPVNGSGTPVSAVTTDITGALRNLVAPTLGAYELICVNPVSGGTIAADQTVGYLMVPASITNTASPSGYSGALEYKWQSAVSPFTAWTDIPGSNASFYQPGAITQTILFKRLVRTTCMSTWTGAAESNAVTITVSMNKWIGAKSNDWNDPDNWTLNRVPAANSTVVFDNAALNDCLLNSDLSVNDIINNQSAYHLIVNGKTLTVNGVLNFSQVPLLDASAPNSTILFSGTTSQTIPSGAFVNDRVYNLTINNSNNVVLNGSLNILNSISAISGRLDAFTNSPTVTYGGTEAQSLNSSSYINDKVYNLIIDNSTGVSLGSDFTINHLLTINTGKQLIVPTGKLLNVEGTISNATTSGLVIKADASGKDTNGSLIFHNASTPESTVPATVEMYTKATLVGENYKWQFFGIPLKSIQANPTFSGSYVREMHEDVSGTTGRWVQLQNESVLTSFTGYEITQDKDKVIYFEGFLENADYSSGPLSYTPDATYKGQHLIGNPYTAAINIKNTVIPANSLTFGEGMDKTVYFYNTGSYADWSGNGLNGSGNNDAAGQYLSVPQENAGNDILPASIPSMQAFLVMVNTPGPTATISIPYSSTGTIVRNATLQRAPSSAKTYTRIDVTGSSSADRMWIFTEPTCTRGFDNGWDGKKLPGSALAPQLYAVEADGDYQVNSIDDINNTLLGFKSGIDTTYTLTFTHQNKDSRYQNIYLMDLSENKTVDITATGSQYTFNSNSGTPVENRFKIVATSDGNGATTETKPTEMGNPVLTVFCCGNTILVNNQSNQNGNLYLYDMMGRIIQIFPFHANTITTLPLKLPMGSYLSKAVTLTKELTGKLVFGK